MIACSVSPIIQIRCPGASVIEYYMIYAGVMFFFISGVLVQLVHLWIVFHAMFPRRRFFHGRHLNHRGYHKGPCNFDYKQGFLKLRNIMQRGGSTI